jgi:hypothetical protein
MHTRNGESFAIAEGGRCVAGYWGVELDEDCWCSSIERLVNIKLGLPSGAAGDDLEAESNKRLGCAQRKENIKIVKNSSSSYGCCCCYCFF